MDLGKTPLFKGIPAADIEKMLPCLGHVTKHYKRGERIIRAGEKPKRIGILTQGRLHTETTDAWGRTTILESLGPGSPFAVAYACGTSGVADIDVVADEDCTVELLKVDRALHMCPNGCSCHAALVRNMLVAMSNNNMALNRRAIAVAPKTVRGKIMAYLSLQQKLNGSNAFAIPFTHEELASYLGADRSTLSAELSKLRSEGIIDYKGKRFTVL